MYTRIQIFLKNSWTYGTPIILQYNFYVFPSKRKSSCLLKSQIKSVFSRLNSQLGSKELFAFIMFPTKYTHFLFQFSHLANASIFFLHVTVQIFIKILFCQWLKIFFSILVNISVLILPDYYIMSIHLKIFHSVICICAGICNCS